MASSGSRAFQLRPYHSTTVRDRAAARRTEAGSRSRRTGATDVAPASKVSEVRLVVSVLWIRNYSRITLRATGQSGRRTTLPHATGHCRQVGARDRTIRRDISPHWPRGHKTPDHKSDGGQLEARHGCIVVEV